MNHDHFSPPRLPVAYFALGFIWTVAMIALIGGIAAVVEQGRSNISAWEAAHERV